MQLIAHGLHMSVGVFVVEIMKTFRVSSIRAGEFYWETRIHSENGGGGVLHIQLDQKVIFSFLGVRS